jgi:cell division protein FtsL
MTEFYTVKQIDNSRLVRPVAPNRLREYFRRTMWAAALASCALFYAWQHFQYIQIRYQIEDLESRRAQTVELNQQLLLEVASLRSPGRIDAIARQQLGLTVPVPGQVAPAQGPNDSVLAQARVPASTPQP